MCFPAHLHYLQSSFEATCKNCLKNFQNMARQARSMCNAIAPCRNSMLFVCPFQQRIFPDSINLQAQQPQPGPTASPPQNQNHHLLFQTTRMDVPPSKSPSPLLSHIFLVHFTFSWQQNKPPTPPQPHTKSAVPFPKYFW